MTPQPPSQFRFCPSCGRPLEQDAEKQTGLCSQCQQPASPRGLRPGGNWGTAPPPQSGWGSQDLPNRVGPPPPDWGVPLPPLPRGSWSGSGPPPWEPAVADQDASDPDNPRWGALAGIGVWLFSILSILGLGVIVAIVAMAMKAGSGIPMSTAARSQFLLSPPVIMASILSEVVAHILTLALVWAVVTRLGERPLLPALGWKWPGWTPSGKVVFVAGIMISMVALEMALGRLLPESHESSFELILKTSASVRIAVAVIATLSAPIVEESVYRGVLYSGLRRALGVWASVTIVSVLFAGVHFLQYWGQWGSIASVSALSIVLTLVRARTKSILPCLAIHFMFNAVGSFFILGAKY